MHLTASEGNRKVLNPHEIGTEKLETRQELERIQFNSHILVKLVAKYNNMHYNKNKIF